MFHRLMNYGEIEPRPSVVLTRDLIKRTRPKYKRVDDLIIVHEAAWEEFKKSMPMPVVREDNSPFSVDEDELASLVCQTISGPIARRLVVYKGIKDDDYRSPNVEIILGDTGVVNHKENDIIYKFDVTKCMFSFGNVNEKMRMAKLDCSEENVVDLFAGIGYFSLPLLVYAKVKHLYACEWNPAAVASFKKNLVLNKLDTTRCTVIEGDNRSNRPTDVAQRVLLGILPSCLEYMKTAFECIDKNTGAVLHCHELVEAKPPEPPQEEQPSSSSSSAGELSCTEKQQPSTSQCALNQSISSSSSSHSHVDRLLVPSPDDKAINSSDSDKDTSSPVLLEKPTGSSTNVSISLAESSIAILDDSSPGSSNNEDSTSFGPPHIMDWEQSAYEAKAQSLIDSIRIEVEAHDLSIRLVHTQPVKSYAPHVSHVVFDIEIRPKSFWSSREHDHKDRDKTHSDRPPSE